MAVDSPNRSAAHWSQYWATGALTSLPQDFAFNYDGEVRAFWHEQFETLPESGRMLDICTGNGPIALLAAGWAAQHKRAIDITAVDAAVVHPEQIASRRPAEAGLIQTIRFLGETSVEALPFEAESFDLVTSQYGLEYCRIDAAAQELSRVLRPGGRLAILAHEASSDLLETMRAEQREYRALDELRVLRVLRSWVNGQLAEPDLQPRLQRIQRRLYQYYRETQSPLVGQVGQSVTSLLAMSLGELRANREAVAGFLERLEAGRDRLEDMLRVNDRIAQDPNWCRPLDDAGLKRLETRAMVYRGQHPMGRCFIWQRPD